MTIHEQDLSLGAHFFELKAYQYLADAEETAQAAFSLLALGANTPDEDKFIILLNVNFGMLGLLDKKPWRFD